MDIHRRAAFRQLAALLAASPLLRAQQDPFRDHTRVPRLDELLTAFDFEPVAFARIPRVAYNYTAYGSESEFTLRRNRDAFDWVDLLARSPKPPEIDTAIELFGQKLAFPLLLAPSAAHTQLHPEGELATFQGATQASKTPMIVSNNSTYGVDKIAAAAKGYLWWQLYPRQSLDDSRAYLDTAQTNGAQAIVVTIDQQSAHYERPLHDRNLSDSRPPRPSNIYNPYRVLQNRNWYTWTYFDQIRPLVKVPLLAKGILTPEAALACIDRGLDGIIISNHGGRAMDYSPSTLEVLPEIVAAVNGRIPVLIDGGFRRGTDILKALALGAKAVCIGRVPRWGLAAYGAPGVRGILAILQQELVLAMAEAGCASIASINPSILRTRGPLPTVAPPVLPPPPRTPSRELVNVLEFEAMAQSKLPVATFALIAGSQRADFERLTFRSRLMVDSTKLDLTTNLFGQTMFAPILIGPAAHQTRFHPEGELAMARGAAAAQATLILSSQSSYPLDQIPAPYWLQTTLLEIKPSLGSPVTVITLPPNQPIDWAALARLRSPVVLKGLLRPADVETAIARGVSGLILSTYGTPLSSIALLPAVVATVQRRIPVLIDGSFRRGTDILKALILGASAVVVTRPPLWGLAAYGAEGVQTVMETLQSELARNMIMVGAVTPRQLRPDMLRPPLKAAVAKSR